MKVKMTATLVALTAALITGCGGGGGGSTVSTPGTTPGTNPGTSPSTPVSNPVTALDPYTNQTPSGALTNTISGVVYAAPTTGAIVNAYEIQPDGSNGAPLGTSSAAGTDGRFSITMSKQPTGMVRLVAAGGTFVSEGDNSTQANQSLELVTPYITTDYNTYVITPVTHVASRVLAYRAARGANLATAYTAGIGAALQLAGENAPLRGDAAAGIKLLKTVPGSSDDTLNAYLDVVKGLELYGVRYDLPSRTVFRIAASSAEANYVSTGVDGSGNAINVGNWVNGAFDETASRTLAQLSSFTFSSAIQLDFMQELYEDAACKSDAAKPAYFARYPSKVNQFTPPNDSTGRCTAVANNIASLNAKKLTNNRGK